MSKDFRIKKIQEIYPIRENSPDDLFITCGSFEERFLGVPMKLKGDFPKEFILFRFTKLRKRREELIKQMEETLTIRRHKESYHQIYVEHGKGLESILKFHDFINAKELHSKDLFITVDISTFTKDLLINFILYLVNFLQVNKLRLVYTIPGRYASPQEGWLSFGIKSIHLSPMCWNAWSPLKDNLVIIILGFEEMRAWSLLDNFSADLSWLFVTTPGSKPEWNTYCEEYNNRLLREIPPKGKVSALAPIEVSEALSSCITKKIAERYNIFISPLGTKPQILGALYLITSSCIPINIVTTTVEDHNVPYYSWDIGDTFEFFFPTRGYSP